MQERKNYAVKKSCTDVPGEGAKIRIAEFPNFCTKDSWRSSGMSHSSSQLPKKKWQPRTSKLKVEAASGASGDVESTNFSASTLATKNPYILPSPSLNAKMQARGVELALKSFMRRKKSPSDISFLLMAKEMSVNAAIYWAAQLGMDYKRPLAHLRRVFARLVKDTPNRLG